MAPVDRRALMAFAELTTDDRWVRYSTAENNTQGRPSAADFEAGLEPSDLDSLKEKLFSIASYFRFAKSLANFSKYKTQLRSMSYGSVVALIVVGIPNLTGLRVATLARLKIPRKNPGANGANKP